MNDESRRCGREIREIDHAAKKRLAVFDAPSVEFVMRILRKKSCGRICFFRIRHEWRKGIPAIFFLAAMFWAHAPCLALDPGEMLLLVNDRVTAGVELAHRYANQRGIPENRIVALSLPEGETCTRKDYETIVVPAVRKAIADAGNPSPIHCLLTFYGLPLKVDAPEITPEEREKIYEFRRRKQALLAGLKPMNEDHPEHRRTKRKLERLDRRIAFMEKTDERAAFDSELALVLRKSYRLSGWVPNPRSISSLGGRRSITPEEVLMTCRLDGPSPDIVDRIISDSIRVEKEGLTGIAYFDARWPRKTGTEELTGYALYDDAIHRAADVVRRSEAMPAVLNTVEKLFQPGECPNAALYCGWYSLSKYIDAFAWRPGAVGYHIASGECATLKRIGSRAWCKMMLENGAAAVVGPVHEPYVTAFPLPDMFFSLLLQGRLTLVECYFLTLPYLSWQMVLVGDPMYRPFKKRRE